MLFCFSIAVGYWKNVVLNILEQISWFEVQYDISDLVLKYTGGVWLS